LPPGPTILLTDESTSSTHQQEPHNYAYEESGPAPQDEAQEEEDYLSPVVSRDVDIDFGLLVSDGPPLALSTVYDDDDDSDDPRPSNCGLGPRGAADLVLEIDVSHLSEFLWSGPLDAMPPSVYRDLSAKGFTWVSFVNLPDGIDIGAVLTAAHEGGVKVLAEGSSDGSRRGDYAVGYSYDPQPLELLRGQKLQELIDYLHEGQSGRAMRYSTSDLLYHQRSAATANAALMLLPGMRCVRCGDLALADRLFEILKMKSVRRGVFSLPQVTIKPNSVPIVAWKYTRGKEHVLVTVNFTGCQAFADVLCDDAPDEVDRDGNIPVFEMLSLTNYARNPERMRSLGLGVILYEYEIQVFRY
jgi:hypothetical protein